MDEKIWAWIVEQLNTHLNKELRELHLADIPNSFKTRVQA